MASIRFKTFFTQLFQIQNFSVNRILLNSLPCIQQGILERVLMLPLLKWHMRLHPWPDFFTHVEATGLTWIVLEHLHVVLLEELHRRLCRMGCCPVLLVDKIVAKELFDFLQDINHHLLIGFCILRALNDVERGAPPDPSSSIYHEAQTSTFDHLMYTKTVEALALPSDALRLCVGALAKPLLVAPHNVLKEVGMISQNIVAELLALN